MNNVHQVTDLKTWLHKRICEAKEANWSPEISDQMDQIEDDLNKAIKDCDGLIELNPTMKARYLHQLEETQQILWEQLEKLTDPD